MKKEQDVYKLYLDAFSRASARVRFVLIATVLASILVFVGGWNSWKLSWQVSRISHLRTAVEYELWNETVNPDLTAEEERRIERAKRFLAARLLTSETSIRELHGRYQSYMVQHVSSVAVPFLGIVMDVNDLGIFGGLAFTLLLMWAAFSIYQSKRILEVSYRGYKQLLTKPGLEEAKVAYHGFTITQVFSVPPTVVRPHPSWVHWLPRTLFVLPLLVHLAVTGYDIYSKEFAYSVNLAHTRVLFTCEALFGLVIAFLVVLCLRGEAAIDKLWNQAFKDLKVGPLDSGPLPAKRKSDPTGSDSSTKQSG